IPSGRDRRARYRDRPRARHGGTRYDRPTSVIKTARGMRMALVFATIATIVPPVVGATEVALSNMLVGQAGHEPFKLPHDRTDLYDQLQIEFGFDVGRAGV